MISRSAQRRRAFDAGPSGPWGTGREGDQKKQRKATKRYFKRTMNGMLTNSTYYHEFMGRSLTNTVTLLGAIIGFGCLPLQVTSVGSVDSQPSLPPTTNEIQPLTQGFPSTEDVNEVVLSRRPTPRTVLLSCPAQANRRLKPHTTSAGRRTSGRRGTGRGFGCLR